MSRKSLIFWTIFYLFLLNIVANHDIEHIRLSIWPALALGVLSFIISIISLRLLKLFLAFQLLIASAALFFKWQYHVTITEDILLSGFINDHSLTTEMLSVKLIVWVILTGLLPGYFLISCPVKKTLWSKMLKTHILSIGILLLLILSIFYIEGYQLRKKGQIRDPRFAQSINCFSPIDVQYAFVKARKAYKKLKQNYMHITPDRHLYTMKEKDLLVVLVLGESTRGDHFSLNGYEKETNPQLSKIKNLFSFTHATSCDTLTINSMHCLSSPMIHTQKNRMPTQAPFTHIMRDLRFKIEIFSLQTLNLFYHYLGYDTLLSKYAILNKTKEGAKDHALLPFAKKSIAEYHADRKLIVLHTLGSHQTYSDRLYTNKEYFEPYCHNADVAQCSKEDLIRAYDNTILEIDDFLAKIIDSLKNKKALLIYLSDHGESLGENGIYFHGKPVDIAPKEQFNIPWLVWLSPSYKKSENGQKIFKNLQQFSSDTPISHDNFYDSILGCSGIETNTSKTLNICTSL